MYALFGRILYLDLNIYIYICLLVCTHVRDWIYVPSLYVCTYLRMYTHTYVCM